MQFQVDNMSCQHCVRAITSAVKALDAEATVSVDLAHKTVDVGSSLSAERLIAAMVEEGYPARVLASAP